MRTIALLLLFALLSPPANAVTVSRLYDFEPDTKAEADQVDAELDNIISALNGNLNTDNILAGGVATSDIATASVTHVKMGPLGQQVSSSSDIVYRASNTAGLVPNMTANITVYGRPVWVGLQPADGASNPGLISYRNNGNDATPDTAFISFQRDTSTVNQSGMTARNISSPSNNLYLSLPCSAFWFLDDPGVGPHNYTASFRNASGDSGIVTVQNCKLVVFEL